MGFGYYAASAPLQCGPSEIDKLGKHPAERFEAVLVDGHIISKLGLLGALADKGRLCHH
jgi:hypothetical protein